MVPIVFPGQKGVNAFRVKFLLLWFLEDFDDETVPEITSIIEQQLETIDSWLDDNKVEDSEENENSLYEDKLQNEGNGSDVEFLVQLTHGQFDMKNKKRCRIIHLFYWLKELF